MAGEVIEIAVVERNLAFRISEFATLERPASPDAHYCEELVLLSVHHREHAICRLLADYDWPGFASELAESAEARIDLLEWTAEAPERFERWVHTSTNGPFFDAIAAARLDLAKRIAELSRCPLSDDYEYADDRAYTLFLHDLVARDLRPDPALRPHLDAFLEAAEGQITPRYELCEALLEADAAKFEQALRDVIAEHQEAYAEEAEAIRDHYRFRTEQYVFVEGLALRAIGAAMGLRIDDALPSLPDPRD